MLNLPFLPSRARAFNIRPAYDRDRPIVKPRLLLVSAAVIVLDRRGRHQGDHVDRLAGGRDAVAHRRPRPAPLAAGCAPALEPSQLAGRQRLRIHPRPLRRRQQAHHCRQRDLPAGYDAALHPAGCAVAAARAPQARGRAVHARRGRGHGGLLRRRRCSHRERAESAGRQHGGGRERGYVRADRHGAARSGARRARCDVEHDRLGEPRSRGDLSASRVADHRRRSIRLGGTGLARRLSDRAGVPGACRRAYGT